MGKVKKIDKKKVTKIIKKAWYKMDKQKALKILASVVKWITAGKIEKNTVLAVGGIVIALATTFGPTGVRCDVKAANDFREQLQEMIVHDTLEDGTIVTIFN